MKREYAKPFLAVESFQLDAAIAGDCTGKVTLNQQINDCTLRDGMGPVYETDFNFGAACASYGGMDVAKDDACYHAMSLGVAYMIS